MNSGGSGLKGFGVNTNSSFTLPSGGSYVVICFIYYHEGGSGSETMDIYKCERGKLGIAGYSTIDIYTFGDKPQSYTVKGYMYFRYA